MGAEEAKRRAAGEAARLVASLRPRILGVGAGSTVDLFIEELHNYPELLANTVAVAASLHTARRLVAVGLRVLDPSTVPALDLYIDGADEVDPELNMIKGGGGASTMEKVLAHAALRRVFVIDYTKLVQRLGERCGSIPLEVLPQALAFVCRRLEEMGLEPLVRRASGGKYGFVVADTGGVIIDVKPRRPVPPRELEALLKSIPGVIETGLFIGVADLVIVGYDDRVEFLGSWRP